MFFFYRSRYATAYTCLLWNTYFDVCLMEGCCLVVLAVLFYCLCVSLPRTTSLTFALSLRLLHCSHLQHYTVIFLEARFLSLPIPSFYWGSSLINKMTSWLASGLPRSFCCCRSRDSRTYAFLEQSWLQSASPMSYRPLLFRFTPSLPAFSPGFLSGHGLIFSFKLLMLAPFAPRSSRTSAWLRHYFMSLPFAICHYNAHIRLSRAYLHQH